MIFLIFIIMKNKLTGRKILHPITGTVRFAFFVLFDALR